ncbi:MAG: YicC family protein [Flavobacteriales bacterium]|nr:YicC family protein [Flavobacteriales bacterium]
MVVSMTGFGRAEAALSDRGLVVEIRALNSKQFDAQLRLAPALRSMEPQLRQWLADNVVRGKVELHVHLEARPDATRQVFDEGAVKAHYQQLKALAASVAPDHGTDLLGMVLRMPEVLLPVERELNKADEELLNTTLSAAMKAFQEFREVEGARLQADLKGCLDRLERGTDEVERSDQGRVDKVRERLKGKLSELAVEVDADRFEQELVYYLEKFDLNEEKVRLRSHCQHFQETLAGSVGQGRKLGFIAQEMGREINTIGSKANDAGIQQVVVRMKDDLEKIKEQVLNIL